MPGNLPFPEMSTDRVKVRLPGVSTSDFPAFLDIGDLLTYRRPSPPEFAVTLLLTYRHGTEPPRTATQRDGVWYPVPGEPIWGQIRIALPPEAVKEIRVSGDQNGYELHLQDIQLVNVSPQAL